jgi:hypothetical protein
MAKVQRHVELEEAHLIAIQSAFGGSIKLSYLLNEMLYHFHNIIKEKELDISHMMRDASERTNESI